MNNDIKTKILDKKEAIFCSENSGPNFGNLIFFTDINMISWNINKIFFNYSYEKNKHHKLGFLTKWKEFEVKLFEYY